MNRSRHSSSVRISSRGSVLVIVLVTLMFATVALLLFEQKASDDLLVDAREATGRRLRQEAYSALEVTLGVLEDFRQVNGGLRSPAEGWGDPLAFAGWTPTEGRAVEITFEDESGKLSLPHAQLATLITLFRGWGLVQSDAERLADAMLSWMRKDYVSSTARLPDYDQSALPYGPPLRSMRSFSELAAMDYARQMFYDEKGQPNELWHRFVGAISLFDFKETNLNGLNGNLLTDLGLADESRQRQFDDYRNGTGSRARQGPAFFQTTADAASFLNPQAGITGFGTVISALRINLTVRQGRSNFRLSVVIAPSGGATAVKEVAASSSTNTTPNGQTPTPAASTAENPAAAKKLNYPFTLLEIRENAEISAVPTPPTKA